MAQQLSVKQLKAQISKNPAMKNLIAHFNQYSWGIDYQYELYQSGMRSNSFLACLDYLNLVVRPNNDGGYYRLLIFKKRKRTKK